MNEETQDIGAQPHAEVPEQLTVAGARCFDEYADIVEFLLFVAQLAVRADEVQRIAAEALLPDAEGDEERARYAIALNNEASVTSVLRERFAQLFLEVSLARSVDSFLTYIAELIAEVYRHRPETLRSGATVSIEYVLGFASREELVDALAEREVERLVIGGLRELQRELDRTLGFQLFQDTVELDRAVRIVEGRNVIVHNRGVVNKRYLSRVPDAEAVLGKRLSLPVDDLFRDLAFLATSAADIDARSTEKWGLSRRPYRRKSGAGEPPSQVEDRRGCATGAPQALPRGTGQARAQGVSGGGHAVSRWSPR